MRCGRTVFLSPQNLRVNMRIISKTSCQHLHYQVPGLPALHKFQCTSLTTGLTGETYNSLRVPSGQAKVPRYSYRTKGRGVEGETLLNLLIGSRMLRRAGE